MNSKYFYTAVLGLAIALFSCDSNEEVAPQPELNLEQITSVSEQGLTLTLYAKKSLDVGLNALTIAAHDEKGNPLNGTIEVVPMMDMSIMKHSCPVEFPNGKSLSNGMLEFNAAFVMPSGEMGSWTLEVSLQGKKIEVPIEVAQPAESRMVSFVSLSEDSETKYFVCLVDPQDPKVGQNDVHLAIFKKQSMMEWPAVENVQIEMTPWMPSMDHGSPNNVNPVHDADGHYLGKVNFTMTGHWEINLEFRKGEVALGETHFDVSF